MTTHDQQTAALSTTPSEPEFSSESVEMPDWSGEPAAPGPPRMETVPASAEMQPPGNESLFAADTSALRQRWDDIQGGFVDDPSGCVQRADSLVEDVVAQLTSQFADTRSRLEAQWARGETASTEDLRVALMRYREFFQRLLTV